MYNEKNFALGDPINLLLKIHSRLQRSRKSIYSCLTFDKQQG